MPMVEHHNNFYAVIMAGGSGKRFWPLSSEDFPKQFLTFGKKNTLIEQTVKRFLPLIKKRNIFIVSLEKQFPLLKKFLPNFPKQNLILEPAQKNTAACLALSAFYLYEKDPTSIMIATPADNWIDSKIKFHKNIKTAINLAAQYDVLITLGTRPTFPSTAYGYIQRKERFHASAFKVKKFTEKPSLKLAQKFLRSKNYYWNGGIFIWKTAVFLRALRKHLPDTFKRLQNLSKLSKSKQKKAYESLQNISVDYAVMEKSTNCIVIPADFKWDDLGDLTKINQKFIKHINIDSKNNLIHAHKTVATIGVEDLIIIENNGNLLIAKKDRAQDVKKISTSF